MVESIDFKKNKKTEEVTSNFFITNKMQTHFTKEEERRILEEYYSPNVTDNRKKLIENQIVKRNLGLVSKMAWQLKAKYSLLDFEELMSAGLLGFAKGLQKFDRRKGYRLSTYLTWWIRDSMYDCYSKQNLIKIPTDLFYLTNKYRALLSDGFTLEEIMKKLKTSEKDTRRVLDALATLDVVSWEELFTFAEQDLSLFEPRESDKDLIDIKISKELEAAQRAITETIGQRNFNIMKDRFGDDVKKRMTLNELAKKYKSTIPTIKESITYNIAKLRRLFPRKYPVLYSQIR